MLATNIAEQHVYLELTFITYEIKLFSLVNILSNVKCIQYFKEVYFLLLLIYLCNYLGKGFLIGKKHAFMFLRLPLSSLIHIPFSHTLSFSHASPIANAIQTMHVHND